VLALVLDRRVCARPVEDAVCAAFAGGVDWLQLRERELDAEPQRRWIERLGELALRENPNARILVNRRIDVALAGGAHGVHLGFDALPVAEARSLVGAPALIGVSTHAPDEVAEAARAGADYVHLAPILAPKSKPATRPALGLVALREACAQEIAVIAQGGVDERGAGDIVRAGAAGVAVTGAILMSDRPEVAAAGLRRALDATECTVE